jgi:phosphatidate phosphatase APP1
MGIKVMVLDAENKEFYSVNGVTNDKGFFTTEFLIPENSQRQTLTITINAKNENSKSSKILQVFSLGQIPDDGKSSSP